MKKKSFTYWLIIGLLGFLLFQSYGNLFKLKNDKDRLTNNITLLQSEADKYKAKNGQLAQDKEKLQFTLREFKRANFSEILSELENLNIKVNKLQSYTSTTTEFHKEIETTLRDSLVFDTIPVRVWSYSDQWLSAKSIIYPDKQQTSFLSTDTIISVAHYGKRKPFWKIWKPRPLLQTVTNKNPYNKIHFNEVIEIER